MSVPAIALLAALWSVTASPPAYQPAGIGGGGAMAGLAFSPYARLWFVGTDMGTVFRSTDLGASWQAIRHDQLQFGARLERSSPVGFASDPQVVFAATNGEQPKRSRDGGVTWAPIALPLAKGEWLRYWLGDDADPHRVLAATTRGLWLSPDGGTSWARASGVDGESTGTFVAHVGKMTRIFHAHDGGVAVSEDGGRTFAPWWRPAAGRVRQLAGGQAGQRLTLAVLDDDGARACAWLGELAKVAPKQVADAQAECGYVWVMTAAADARQPQFVRTAQPGGRFLRMAAHDPDVLWTTGGNWPHQQGSRVWRSADAGRTWTLALQLLDWERGYKPWPADLLEWSAVGLDVGWHDNAFASFAVDPRDARRAGGTGYYFLHVTQDGGAHWQAPFTAFADTGARAPGMRWRSTGLEVTSIQRLKFHPTQPQLAYAAAADIGGLVTEDGGGTWRIVRTPFNTNYDYALDPQHPDRVWAAAGTPHDFPIGNRDVLAGAKGGVFRSDDRGRHWTRLTPADGPLATAYLAVARRPSDGALFAGTRGQGVVASYDDGKTWLQVQSGMPAGPQVVPQLELDPKSGELYALLTGNGPAFTNAATTGIYRLGPNMTWVSLRGAVPSVTGKPPLAFPTAFAVDWTQPKRDRLWLVDFEVAGSWLGSGVWRSLDGGRSWKRVLQYTHPTGITLDPRHPERVYVSGQWQIDGKWGNGGAMDSRDFGQTWQQNTALPLLANLDGMSLDPNRPGQLFYLFFGGGMLRGPLPR